MKGIHKDWQKLHVMCVEKNLRNLPIGVVNVILIDAMYAFKKIQFKKGIFHIFSKNLFLLKHFYNSKGFCDNNHFLY